MDEVRWANDDESGLNALIGAALDDAQGSYQDPDVASGGELYWCGVRQSDGAYRPTSPGSNVSIWENKDIEHSAYMVKNQGDTLYYYGSLKCQDPNNNGKETYVGIGDHIRCKFRENAPGDPVDAICLGFLVKKKKGTVILAQASGETEPRSVKLNLFFGLTDRNMEPDLSNAQQMVLKWLQRADNLQDKQPKRQNSMSLRRDPSTVDEERISKSLERSDSRELRHLEEGLDGGYWSQSDRPQMPRKTTQTRVLKRPKTKSKVKSSRPQKKKHAEAAPEGGALFPVPLPAPVTPTTHHAHLSQRNDPSTPTTPLFNPFQLAQQYQQMVQSPQQPLFLINYGSVHFYNK